MLGKIFIPGTLEISLECSPASSWWVLFGLKYTKGGLKFRIKMHLIAPSWKDSYLVVWLIELIHGLIRYCGQARREPAGSWDYKQHWPLCRSSGAGAREGFSPTKILLSSPIWIKLFAGPSWDPGPGNLPRLLPPLDGTDCETKTSKLRSFSALRYGA